jgi:hypothetical protein
MRPTWSAMRSQRSATGRWRGPLVRLRRVFRATSGAGHFTIARSDLGIRTAVSRTPCMYADGKSDEIVVPRKRPNKGWQLRAEVVEGRRHPRGTADRAVAVRTLSQDAMSIRLPLCAGAHAVSSRVSPDIRLREEPGALVWCLRETRGRVQSKYVC